MTIPLPDTLRELARLYRRRGENPFVTCYHFGYRTGLRGAYFHIMRAGFCIVPVVLALAAIGVTGWGRRVLLARDTVDLYSVFALALLLFYPALCFQLFGVRRLDQQKIEELRLTRMTRREILFGLYYWPITTSFFALIPLFAGQVFLLMFSEYTWNIGTNLVISGGLYVSFLMMCSATTAKYWLLPGSSRYLLMLVDSLLSVLVLWMIHTVWAVIIYSTDSLRREGLATMMVIPFWLMAAGFRWLDAAYGATGRLLPRDDLERADAARSRTVVRIPALRMFLPSVATLLALVGLFWVLTFASALTNLKWLLLKMEIALPVSLICIAATAFAVRGCVPEGAVPARGSLVLALVFQAPLMGALLNLALMLSNPGIFKQWSYYVPVRMAPVVILSLLAVSLAILLTVIADKRRWWLAAIPAMLGVTKIGTLIAAGQLGPLIVTGELRAQSSSRFGAQGYASLLMQSALVVIGSLLLSGGLGYLWRRVYTAREPD